MYQYKLDENINHNENIKVHKYITGENEQVHTHEFIELVYIKSGKGQHIINDTCYEVGKGHLLFINFGQTHAFHSYASMEIVNILIKPEFIDTELINSENAFEILALSSFEEFDDKVDILVPMITFRGKELIEIEVLIENMLAEFSKKPTNYKTSLKGYLLILLTKIFREMQRADVGKILHQVSKITPDILKYIEENCFEKITLTQLAQKCFYNPSYFSKVFSDYYGKSLTEFIHEKRILEAMRLLKETDLSIEAISSSIGYTDRKQFYKIFKKHIGSTPSQVRIEVNI